MVVFIIVMVLCRNGKTILGLMVADINVVYSF
jgi:hypothetical protein